MNKFNKELVPLSGWCDSERYNSSSHFVSVLSLLGHIPIR